MGGCLAVPPGASPVKVKRRQYSNTNIAASRISLHRTTTPSISGGSNGSSETDIYLPTITASKKRNSVTASSSPTPTFVPAKRGSISGSLSNYYASYLSTFTPGKRGSVSSGGAAIYLPSHPEAWKKWKLVQPRTQAIEQGYLIGQMLGEGTSGVVKECTSQKDGRTYAVKCILRKNLDADNYKSLLEEVSILSHLQHPSIVRYHDFLVGPQHYYVVQELVKGGELFDRITQKNTYTEKEARDLFRILVEAILYMHDLNVVHRDLKPENLLLVDGRNDVHIKICDFGFAAKLNEDQPTLKAVCGTPGYVAPEVLKKEAYGREIDMWSLGVITYILLGGYPPFYDNDQRKLFMKIKRGAFAFHDDVWGAVSKEAKHLISAMLTVDPTKRLTAVQALQHPWLQKEDEVLAANNLEGTKKELQRFSAKRRFRAGVRSVMAANKLNNKISSLHKKKVDRLDRIREGAVVAIAEEEREEEEEEEEEEEGGVGTQGKGGIIEESRNQMGR